MLVKWGGLAAVLKLLYTLFNSEIKFETINSLTRCFQRCIGSTINFDSVLNFFHILPIYTQKPKPLNTRVKLFLLVAKSHMTLL